MHGLPPPLVDKRSLSWAELERDIAERACKRDSNFRLEGPWRIFLRKECRDGEEFAVYVVDAEWVYNNLTIQFGHGGHGYVHECIPLDEIWVAKCHTAECAYQEEEREAHRIGKRIQDRERDAIIVHEIAEFGLMKSGMDFWAAHNLAVEVEERWSRSNER